MKKFLKIIFGLVLVVSCVINIAFCITNNNLQKQNKNYEEQIQMYEDNEQDLADALKNLHECNKRITTLEVQLDAALKEGKENKEKVVLLTSQLESAKEEQQALQNEVVRLRGLLDSYQGMEEGTIEVNFYNGKELVLTRAIVEGMPVLVDVKAEKLYHKFLGWSLDKVNVVDPSTITATEPLDFYAVFELQAGLYKDDGTYTPWADLYADGYLRQDPNETEKVLYTGNAYSQLRGTLVLDKSIEKIADLQNCKNLKAVIINAECTEIAELAFMGCWDIETIFIPKTVTTIGAGAFFNTNGYGGGEITIYCEAETQQANWLSGEVFIDPLQYGNGDPIFTTWNGDQTVKYGYTYEQYMAEINA